MKKARILITGGGTGGHIYPLIAVAAELKILATEQNSVVRVRYIGAGGGYKEVIKENGIEFKRILSSKLRNYFSLKNIIDIPKFAISVFQALWKIFWFMPDVVFSKGGAGAVAIVLAARFYRIPVVIHESDTVPGMTSKITSRFAEAVVLAFPEAEKYFGKTKGRIVQAGNPIRNSLLADQTTQQGARNLLGLDPRLPLVLVIGGSQGAMRINDFILDNLTLLLQFTQILHQTGKRNYNMVVNEFEVVKKDLPENLWSRYRAIGYFEKDMGTALTAADVIVSRAGASAITEIAAFGKPSILIPLPEAANGHQLENASVYGETGAAIIMEEPNLLPNLFIGQLRKLFETPNTLTGMSKAARAFYQPDAALKLAQIILTIKG